MAVSSCAKPERVESTLGRVRIEWLLIRRRLAPEEMREVVEGHVDDLAALDQQVAELQSSSETLEDLALLSLSVAWADPHERETVRVVLEAANKALPVIDTVVLAIESMYAMYLLATGGQERSIRRTKRGADGSFEEETETIYADPSPWLGAFWKLFRPQKSQ